MPGRVMPDRMPAIVAELRRDVDRLLRQLVSSGTDVINIETILSGGCVVGNDKLVPGLRIPNDTVLREVHVEVGTAPVGADLIVQIRDRAAGTLYATCTVTGGTTTGTTIGLSQALADGDRLRIDITQVGSTTAGRDLAVAIECRNAA